MTAKDVLRYEMDTGLMVLKTYVSDLSDADLMIQFVTVRRMLGKPVLI
jgi:hypothetical protein